MKKTLALLLALVMIFSLCACSKSEPAPAETPAADSPAADAPSADAAAEIEEITLTMADPATTGTFLTNNAQFFCDTVEELSGGKMKIDLFADGLLGTEDACIANIQTGALECGSFSSAFTNLVKSAGIFDFPYLLSDRSQLDLLEQGGVIDFIKAEAETYNVKIVAMNENGFRQITSAVKPIYTPEDMSGLAIRTPSNTLRVKTFETMGALPTAISFSELYQSLSQHIVDAQENPVSQVIAAKLYEVQKYLCISNHVYTPGWICMNLDLYNSLSDAQRAIIDEAGAITTAHVREAAVEQDEIALQQCIDAGMEVNEVDTEAFREKVLPLWDEFADNVGGAEFVDMTKTALGIA